MKLIKLASLLMVLALSSCGKDVVDETATSQPVEDEKAIVNFSVEQAATRAATLKDYVSTLQYWIFDSQTEKLCLSKTQKSTDSDFGTICDTLKYGDYKIVVVGHNMGNEMQLSDDNELVGPSDTSVKYKDTYYGCHDFSLGSDTSAGGNISISRNMAYLVVRSDGSVGDNIAYIKVTVNGYGMQFYSSTGYSQTTKSTNEYLLNVASIKTNYVNINFYIPLPDDEKHSLDFTFDLLDADQNTLSTVAIDSIPVQIGHKTTFKGSLWDYAYESTITVDATDWIEDLNGTY